MFKALKLHGNIGKYFGRIWEIRYDSWGRVINELQKSPTNGKQQLHQLQQHVMDMNKNMNKDDDSDTLLGVGSENRRDFQLRT